MKEQLYLSFKPENIDISSVEQKLSLIYTHTVMSNEQFACCF